MSATAADIRVVLDAVKEGMKSAGYSTMMVPSDRTMEPIVKYAIERLDYERALRKSRKD